MAADATPQLVDARVLSSSHVYDHTRPLDTVSSAEDILLSLSHACMQANAAEPAQCDADPTVPPSTSQQASCAAAASNAPSTSSFTLSPDASRAIILHTDAVLPRVCTATATDGFSTHLDVPIPLSRVHACLRLRLPASCNADTQVDRSMSTLRDAPVDNIAPTAAASLNAPHPPLCIPTTPALPTTQAWACWTPDSRFALILLACRPVPSQPPAAAHPCFAPCSSRHHSEIVLCVWDVTTHTNACTLSTAVVAPESATLASTLQAWTAAVCGDDDIHDMLLCACTHPSPDCCSCTVMIAHTHGQLTLVQVTFPVALPRESAPVCVRGCGDRGGGALHHPRSAVGRLPSQVHAVKLAAYMLPRTLRTITGIAISTNFACAVGDAPQHAEHNFSMLMAVGLPQSADSENSVSSRIPFLRHAFAARDAPIMSSSDDARRGRGRVVLALRLEIVTHRVPTAASSSIVSSTSTAQPPLLSAASSAFSAKHPHGVTSAQLVMLASAMLPPPTLPTTHTLYDTTAALDALSLCAAAACETGVNALVHPATTLQELERTVPPDDGRIHTTLISQERENAAGLHLLRDAQTTWVPLPDETLAKTAATFTATSTGIMAAALRQFRRAVAGVAAFSMENTAHRASTTIPASPPACAPCAHAPHATFTSSASHVACCGTAIAPVPATLQVPSTGPHSASTHRFVSNTPHPRDVIAFSPYHASIRATFASNSSTLPASIPASPPFISALALADGRMLVCALCVGDAASSRSYAGLLRLQPHLALMPPLPLLTRHVWWDSPCHVIACDVASCRVLRVRVLPADASASSDPVPPPDTHCVWSPSERTSSLIPSSLLPPFVAAMPEWPQLQTTSRVHQVLSCAPMQPLPVSTEEMNEPAPIVMVVRAEVEVPPQRLSLLREHLSTCAVRGAATTPVVAHLHVLPAAVSPVHHHVSLPILVSRFSVDECFRARVCDDSAPVTLTTLAEYQLVAMQHPSQRLLSDSLRARAWMDAFTHVHDARVSACSASSAPCSPHHAAAVRCVPCLSPPVSSQCKVPIPPRCTSTYLSRDVEAALGSMGPHVYACMFITAVACAPTRVSTHLLLRLQRCMPVMHSAVSIALETALESADPHAWGCVHIHAPQNIAAASSLLTLALTRLYWALSSCCDPHVRDQLHSTFNGEDDSSMIHTHTLLQVAHSTLLTRAARTAWYAHALTGNQTAPLHLHGREWLWYIDAHALTAAYAYATRAVLNAVASYSGCEHLAWPSTWTQQDEYSYTCSALDVLLRCAHDMVLPFRLALLERALEWVPPCAMLATLPALPAPATPTPRARLMSAETGVPSQHVLIDMTTWKRVPPRSRNHTRADSHTPMHSPGGTVSKRAMSDAASATASVSISHTSALLKARARAHGAPRSPLPASPRLTARTDRREPASPYMLLSLPVGDADTYAQYARNAAAARGEPASPSQVRTVRKMTLDLAGLGITPVAVDEDALSTPTASRKPTLEAPGQSWLRVPPSPSLYARHIVTEGAHEGTSVAAAAADAASTAINDWSCISHTTDAQLLPLHVTECVPPTLLRNEHTHTSLAALTAPAFAAHCAHLVEHTCVCTRDADSASTCMCDDVYALIDSVASATGLRKRATALLQPLMPPHSTHLWACSLSTPSGVDLSPVHSFFTSPIHLAAWYACMALENAALGHVADALTLLAEGRRRFEYNVTSTRMLARVADALCVCDCTGIPFNCVGSLSLQDVDWRASKAYASVQSVLRTLGAVAATRSGAWQDAFSLEEHAAVGIFVSACLARCSEADVVKEATACAAECARATLVKVAAVQMEAIINAHIGSTLALDAWSSVVQRLEAAFSALDLLRAAQREDGIHRPVDPSGWRAVHYDIQAIYQHMVAAPAQLRPLLQRICEGSMSSINTEAVDHALQLIRSPHMTENVHAYTDIMCHRVLPLVPAAVPRDDSRAAPDLVRALQRLQHRASTSSVDSELDTREQKVCVLMEELTHWRREPGQIG